jgi:hypothetical protein
MREGNKTPLLDTCSNISAVLLLALMAVLAGGSALRESVTIDEVTHIGAGVSYLQKFDLRLNDEHPPLPKVLAALPLVVRGVHADYNHVSWTFSEKFFPAYLGQWSFGCWLLEKWNDPHIVLPWARFPMLLLTLALGWVVYACGRRLGGPWGALLCLTVFISNPTFLAFGPLVHTDLAMALFSLLCLWTFANIWCVPSRKHVLMFAMSLAAALLSKFTTGVLLVVFAASALSLRWAAVPGQPSDRAELRQWRRARRRATLKGIFWAGLLVYLFYFVFSWNQPTGALYRLGSGPVPLIVRRLLFPPVLYLRGVAWVLMTATRPTFLLGHWYPHGVWFYFPVVFALKSPLGFLGLLLLSLVAGILLRLRDTPICVVPEYYQLHWRVIWVSLLVFTGVCLLSPLDISIRHFSVPILLMTLLLAPLPRVLGNLRRRTRLGAAVGIAAAGTLAASCLVAAVSNYPFYFPYVNALSLGRPAYALVNDSNVDWNQSLPEVRRFAEQHGLTRIGLDQYGYSDPTIYAPQVRPWKCQKPRDEDGGNWVTLSANLILDGHNCTWLMQYPHEALAGGSIYAVYLPLHIGAPGSAGGPPMPSQFRNVGGAPFDFFALLSYVFEHPDELQQTMDWIQANFSEYGKTKALPSPPPWEH